MNASANGDTTTLYSPWKLFISAPIPLAMAKADARPCSKLLFGRLLMFAGQDGACYPTLSRISESMCWSERKVSRELAHLVRLGVLKRRQLKYNRSAHCSFVWQDFLAGSLIRPDTGLEVGRPYLPYKRFLSAFVPLPVLQLEKLASGAKLLFGVLALHAADGCHCFPALAQLATEMACSERTVSRWMDELVKHGFIRRFRTDPSCNSTCVFIWNESLRSGLRSDVVVNAFESPLGEYFGVGTFKSGS